MVEKNVLFRDSKCEKRFGWRSMVKSYEGFKSYLRPSPGDIMDKLRSGSIKSGYIQFASARCCQEVMLQTPGSITAIIQH